MARRIPFQAAVLGALTLSACSHVTGGYVWVDSYPVSPSATEKDYVIAPGDQLSVRVYNQEPLSGRARVRADGKISLPFVNDVQAAGLTPTALADHVQKRLKEFIVNPMVTVSLEEAHPIEVFAVGEVVRPGRITLDGNGTVLQVIASAGGLTPYASANRIFVVRQGPPPIRIRFRYEDLTRLEGKAGAFRLRNGDTLVVE